MSTLTAVYDAHEGFYDHPWPFVDAYRDWLTEHGIDTNDTYRTEHHVIDTPLVRVFQYAKDADGRRYTDPATGNVAEREPFDVLIKTPPPTPEEYR